MPLRPLYGHEGLRHRLAGAIAAGRLPQAILLEGPPGVGKQRLALWVAQALLCDRPARGEACGSCSACKLVLNLSHPDLHWFFPLEISRKGADADKQVELVEDALGEELAVRRESPDYSRPTGLASHGIAAVRLMLRRLVLTPAMARRKVLIVGDAERLIPQAANPEAANALLKALEEPPADTFIVLTAQAPDALLPTILSRVVRIRVARLPDSVVTEFVHRELGVNAEQDVKQRVASADGCIGKLFAPGSSGQATGAISGEALLAAARRGSRDGPVARLALALAQPPFQARGGFTALLDDLLGRLHDEARAGRDTGTVVAALSRVLDARELAQGNVNPQLLTAVLAEDLGEGA